MVQRLVAAADYEVSIRELVRQVLRVWNGPVGLATSLRQEFLAAKPGSNTRVALLTNLMKLIAACDDSAEQELEADDEELKPLAAAMLNNLEKEEIQEGNLPQL